MLRAVLFDAAGTLIEPRERVGASYARIARKYGVEASADQVHAGFHRAFGEAPPLAFGPQRSAEELRRLEKDWWCERVRESLAGIGGFTDFDAYFEELFAFFADPANWRIDPQGPPLLERLKARGCRLAIVSNFDHRLYRILTALGLSSFFEAIVISSEAGYAKPAAEIFRLALERLAVGAAEALHVGDSEHLDAAGAIGAGIRAVLIDPAAQERLRINGSVARISGLEMIMEAIAGF